MSADLGHEKYFVAPAFQSTAHPNLRLAVVVFPAVIEKRDAAVDGFVNDALGLGLILGVSKVVTAKTEGRNLHIVASKFLKWDAVGGWRGRVLLAVGAVHLGTSNYPENTGDCET